MPSLSDTSSKVQPRPRNLKDQEVTFPSGRFLKTYRNEKPWKQNHEKKCWSNIDNTNTCEVIEPAQRWFFMRWITNMHMIIVHIKIIANTVLIATLGFQ